MSAAYFPKRFFADRKADVNFLNVRNPDVLQVAPQTLAINQACTGILKLAQKVALRMLTPSNGIYYESGEGGVFMRDALTGSLMSIPDISASVNETILSVENQFINDTINFTDIPLDEQLSDLQVISVQIQGDSAFVTLQLTNRLGSTYSWISPVKVQP